jgi:asparagine synthase (glutamine-hydrolysing)
MCGIAGMINFNGKSVTLAQIRKMTDLIRHRGPDDEGYWVKGNIGFGHRRLSIIDLSRAAGQPMFSPDKRLVLTFNGEIYNYKELREDILKDGLSLRTDSDSEVILGLFQLYHVGSFEMLRGMFAFALWDNESKELYLVRDRMGIKPLYYLLNREKLVFASEIKAIAALEPHLTFDKNAFWKFLRTAVFNGAETVFSEIRRLEPGTYMKVEGQNIKHKSYWNLKDSFAAPIVEFSSQQEAIENFKDRFQEAVNYHLVADVPLGGFLSGGLDSGAVMGYMRKIKPNIDIYTSSVIFPGYPDYYNEEPFSDQAAQFLNTRHEKVIFDTNFFKRIDELVWYCDEPFGIAASYALYFLAQQTSKSVKVVLTGDGADELLAGYRRYLEPKKHYTHGFKWLLGIGAKIMKPLLSPGNDKLLNLWLKMALRSTGEALQFSNRTYAPASVFLYLNQDYIRQAWETWQSNAIAFNYRLLENNSNFRRRLYALMKTQLVDEMLTKVDRMTMAHSLEARVPFLDHRFVEFCNSLPDDYKIRRDTGGKVQNKYILRQILHNLLPPEIIDREKHGFDIPFNEWFNRENLKEISGMTLNGILVKNNIIHRQKFERLLSTANLSNNRHAQLVISIYLLEVWYRSYRRNIPGFSLVF